MPCYKYTKDDNWNNNQRQSDKQGPGIWSKYQPPSQYEFLQKIQEIITRYGKN